MELKNTVQDKAQWDAFHTRKAVRKLTSMKETMHETLVSSIDVFIKTLDRDKEEMTLLTNLLSRNGLSQNIIELIHLSQRKLQAETNVTKELANFYLLLMDVNTYEYNCFLANDDWEWRVFARHLFTIIYEHKDAINPLLNDIVRTLKEELGAQYGFSGLIKSKKEFVKVTEDVAEYAKTIRVNTDAHFDKEFEKRLKIIEEMSYVTVVSLLQDYWIKTSALLQEIKTTTLDLQNDVSNSMQEIACQVKLRVEQIKS